MDLDDLDALYAATDPLWVVSSGNRGFLPGRTIFANSERGRVVLETAEMGASEEQFIADAAFAVAIHNSYPALRRRLEAAEAREARLREAIEKIYDWYNSYPLEVFPELSAGEMQFADSVLHEAGISMPALHAGWARHIVVGIGDIARLALASLDTATEDDR